MNFAEPNDGFKPRYKPAPGMPSGMSPLPKELPPELTKPDAIPRGRGVRSKNPFPAKPLPGNPTTRIPRKTPLPNTNPKPASPNRLPDFRKIGRDIAWEILKPTPTADGTLPDFQSEPKVDPDFQPESGNQDSILESDCLSPSNYGLPPDTELQVYQFELVEATYSSATATSGDGRAVNWNRKMGIAKTVGRVIVPESELIKRYTTLKGKVTIPDTGPDPLVYYEFSVQERGRIPGTGRYWQGQWGVAYSPNRYKSRDYGPYRNGVADISGYSKRFTQVLVGYQGSKGFCPEEPQEEPTNPNEYDRQDDDPMPCKWKPTNDPRVESLELEEIEYQKFSGCYFYSDGSTDHFSTEVMMVPKLISAIILRMLTDQNKQLAEMCDRTEPVLVVPDWMPLKWANVEKLVVMYAEKVNGKYKSAKYQVTIPHWGKNQTDTKNHGFTSISKGQFQLIHEMKDSSRITLNCATSQECNSKMLEFLRGVNVNYRNTITVNPAVRGGTVLAQIEIHPVDARFFKAGTDEIKPEWTVRLT